MSEFNNEYLGKWVMENGTEVRLEDTIDFEFDFGFRDINGLSKIEERVESRMKDVVVEEIDKVCLHCASDKMYDEHRNEMYCPVCE